MNFNNSILINDKKKKKEKKIINTFSWSVAPLGMLPADDIPAINFALLLDIEEVPAVAIVPTIGGAGATGAAYQRKIY